MVTNCKACAACVPEMPRLYTLAEAERLLNKKKAVVSQRRKWDMVYFFKQKICGIIMLLIGIFCPIFLDGDATFSLIAIPMGIGLFITKKKLMNFRQKAGELIL